MIVYPKALLDELKLSSKDNISEKKMFDIIISKCHLLKNKLYYRMPRSLYLKLVTDIWLIEGANQSDNEFFNISKGSIKKFIKKNGTKKTDNDIYVSLSAIFNNNIVEELNVII